MRPDWQLPPGVTRGLWEYSQADHIATEYDDYFAFNQLFKFDEQVLATHLQTPGVVVDLGSGTGRALLPLVRRGFRGVAVDLSLPMLGEVGRKAAIEHVHVDRVRANLVQLDCLADATADYCICMYSTLGMIRGRDAREKVVAHARRILKPGGLLVIHVHNFWYNVFEPLSRAWALKSIARALLRRDTEAGDKYFDYRRIPNMFLHVFTQSELVAALQAGGFRVNELIPLDTARQAALRHPWLLGRFRANGWIAVGVAC